MKVKTVKNKMNYFYIAKIFVLVLKILQAWEISLIHCTDTKDSYKSLRYMKNNLVEKWVYVPCRILGNEDTTMHRLIKGDKNPCLHWTYNSRVFYLGVDK